MRNILQSCYLCVEVILYFLQYLIQLSESSGGKLAVNGPIGANTADGHIHIGAVHLRINRRLSCRELIDLKTHTLASCVPATDSLASCPVGISCRRH